MTAQETYEITVASSKTYVYTEINNAARNGDFVASIETKYLLDAVIEELEKDGYRILNPNSSTHIRLISWRKPNIKSES